MTAVDVVTTQASKSHTGLFGLPYTVIRIRGGDLSNAGQYHTGTGFFYSSGSGPRNIPLIVSNKHVLCNKAWLEFDFGLATNDQERIFGPPTTIRIDAGSLPIFEHPDRNVDLAAIPLGPFFQQLKEDGKTPHTLLMTSKNFASDELISTMQAATSVLMVGFPNGVMDEANNLPVVRKGVLATPYAANYGGQSNFVVDIASFGGSSGSPVFAMFEHVMQGPDGELSLMTQPQISLIGVLHSGPVMSTNGNIVAIPVPTNHFVAQTNVMIHLGYCLKAFRIEELAQEINGVVEAHSRLI